MKDSSLLPESVKTTPKHQKSHEFELFIGALSTAGISLGSSIRNQVRDKYFELRT